GSSSSNHGTELLPKAVTVLGLIDIQENALLTRTLNSVELNSRSPSRTEAGFQVLPRLWVVGRSWGY
ncbi:MAG: hypothetical protein BRC57_12455, partial [Cyanobacteria bacterium QS_8_48_54]